VLVGEIVRPWREIPQVVRATESILRTHDKAARATTEAVLAMARQMTKIRELLPPGEFQRWAREAVPFGLRTVRNYLALAAWTDAAPAVMAELAHLGPSKLYRLASLPPRRLRKFVPRTPIPIPGAGAKTLEMMTVKELDRVIGDLAPVPTPPPALDSIVQGFRHRLAGLGAIAQQLVAHADDVDPTLAGELLAELHGLTETLETAFG
jgi:hypothetical protein